jgi:hypothetical protein
MPATSPWFAFALVLLVMAPFFFLAVKLQSAKRKTHILVGKVLFVICFACIGYGVWLIVAGDSSGWTWIWRPAVMAAILLAGWVRFREQ